jgi:hypothetical protein
MKHVRLFVTLGFVLLHLYAQGADSSLDAFLGKWVLDQKASRYPAHTCPKEMTIEMTQEGKNVHYHSHTVPNVGETFEVEYAADYEGHPAMVKGTKGILLPVSLERKGLVVVATYRKAFQIAATSQRVLSSDNKTMTITTASYDPEGSAVTNIGVYRRVHAGMHSE